MTEPFVTVDSDSEVCGSEEPPTNIRLRGEVRDKKIPSVFWPYFICALFWLIAGIFALILGIRRDQQSIEEKYVTNDIDQAHHLGKLFVP